MKRVAQVMYQWLKRFRIFHSFLQKDREKIKGLFPGEVVEKRLEKYYVETLVLILKIAAVGFGGATILGICHGAGSPGDTVFLERNEYGEGNRYVDIVGYGKNGYVIEESLIVREREYTKQDLERLYENLLPLLEEKMLGENLSLEKIQKNLVFPTEISGFPFSVKWKSGDTGVINRRGELQEKYIELERSISVTATIEYNDFSKEHTWDVTVIPEEWTDESVWKFDVQKALEQSDDASKTEKYWSLPAETEGDEIKWRIEKKSIWIDVAGLSFVCIWLVIWGRNNDLKRQIKRRDSVLEKEYSNIVTKLTLYLGAGMTVKSAWKKTASQSGIKGENVAIKEMVLTSREMDSGISERMCYENFGKRCGRQEYVRLGTLLSQNLKKGNSELLRRLQEEVEQVREKQKHLVRRKGEEASTKLLGPMVVLLGITMVLIMIPAFSGIG